jgi:hypothetical protein
LAPGKVIISFAEAKHGQRNRLVVTDNTMRAVLPTVSPASVSFLSRTEAVQRDDPATLLKTASAAAYSSPAHSVRPTIATVLLLLTTLRGNNNLAKHSHRNSTAERIPQHNHVSAVFAGNAISASPIGSTRARFRERSASQCV